MIKNRTAQLIFQTAFCVLGLIGCVASLGVFDNIKMIRCIKRYTDDEIVLQGCNGDEYTYGRTNERTEQFITPQQ